ncbi:MAG TPA: SRPBCC family protein [Puia sp.]|nr:SRPBCC family protein [Puia sp.]
MSKQNLIIRFTVNKPAAEVFEAVNRVKDWWTENLEGASSQSGDEFSVQFDDVHYSKQKLVEFVPGKKVSWLITESHLSWLQNKTEWTGNRLVFEITPNDKGTELKFEQVGLTPEQECYNGCSSAWNQYIGSSLKQLIMTGKGNPEPEKTSNPKGKSDDFQTTLKVKAGPEAVFKAIGNVRGWWSQEIKGGTENLNDEFDYHYQDVHRCKIKLTEVVPNRKIVWEVLDNHFSFTKDKSEWIGTKIIFDIRPTGDGTEIHFTHQGLVPEYECYSVCENAWTDYIQHSLRDLITTGKGKPNPKE